MMIKAIRHQIKYSNQTIKKKILKNSPTLKMKKFLLFRSDKRLQPEIPFPEKNQGRPKPTRAYFADSLSLREVAANIFAMSSKRSKMV